MPGSARGYRGAMTHPDERPIDYEVPEEEEIEPAQVADQLEDDPEELRNLTEQHPDDEDAEDS